MVYKHTGNASFISFEPLTWLISGNQVDFKDTPKLSQI